MGGAPYPRPARRASSYGEKDVWGIFTPLAIKHDAVNLGQGFPNLPAPSFVKEAACEAIEADLNQYAPSKGLPRLRKALSTWYSEDLLGRTIDADDEILVTQGANQGIALAMQAFINEGDEVILIEPFFDIYKPAIEVCGGVVRTVPLRLRQGCEFGQTISASEWKLDMAELEGAISGATKAIMINNPHNPTGKVFDRAELKGIAAIAQRHNLLIFSDEVYDSLFYGERAPDRMAKLEGMWDRTVTFGSGGKTFGVTGWRIGWAIAPKHLLKYMLAVHARTVFTAPTPLQSAVAAGFEHCLSNPSYMDDYRADFRRRRDQLAAIFSGIGLPVAVPDGSYFMMVNTQAIRVDLPLLESEECTSLPPQERASSGESRMAPPSGAVMETRDYAICRWLTEEIGVTAIPPSAFYEGPNKALAANLIRVCFCKSDETLRLAGERLQRLREYTV